MSSYKTDCAIASLFEVSNNHIEISALYIENEKVYLRLFNASGCNQSFNLTVYMHPEKIERTELDGRVIEEIIPGKYHNGRFVIAMEMQPFELNTLAFAF